MEFCVPIVVKSMVNYIVEAASVEEAKQLAKQKWENGISPDDCGNEWEVIDRIGDIEEVEE